MGYMGLKESGRLGLTMGMGGGSIWITIDRKKLTI